MATTPTLYSIDIVEQQKIEQPRVLSVDIVEVRLPLNLPLLFDINISWIDYIKNDSNALFAFSGL